MAKNDDNMLEREKGGSRVVTVLIALCDRCHMADDFCMPDLSLMSAASEARCYIRH